MAGHRGFDTGAVCEDGLTEVEVNEAVAELVVARYSRQRASNVTRIAPRARCFRTQDHAPAREGCETDLGSVSASTTRAVALSLPPCSLARVTSSVTAAAGGLAPTMLAICSSVSSPLTPSVHNRIRSPGRRSVSKTMGRR